MIHKRFYILNLILILGFLIPSNGVFSGLQSSTALQIIPVTLRVSVASDGTQSNANVMSPQPISANGRYVAFTSAATNLVSGDTNGYADIFVHDSETGVTTRVSVASDGSQSNDLSDSPSISADGRFVAFRSNATNLVGGDTNHEQDVFVHNRATGQTELVSVASDGAQGNDWSASPSISADGRYVAFVSSATNLVSKDTNGTKDIFIRDQQTGATTRTSVAWGGLQSNGPSDSPSISADGRFVAFKSNATNLVSEDTNDYADIFIRDQQTGSVKLISVSDSGWQADADSYQPVISANGRFVAFYTVADNLGAGGGIRAFPDIFVRDWQGETTTCISLALDGSLADAGSSLPSISADGRFVAFESSASNLVSGDTNGYKSDVFVHDRATGKTELVSVASDGTQASTGAGVPSISADGTFVSFVSGASNLVEGDTNERSDIFVRFRGEMLPLGPDSTTIVSVASNRSQGNGDSVLPSLSADGRFVAFVSEADNLVSEDTNGHRDVFVTDRISGEITLVSSASDGALGNDDSSNPSLSGDGRYITFESAATNLVSGDTNSALDVFVHDRQTSTTERISVASDGAQSNDLSEFSVISADGRFVAFISTATNLVSGDTNGYADIFVHDRQTGSTTLISVGYDGSQADGWSGYPSVSADGRFVAFASVASNLVSGDANSTEDIFVYDRQTGAATIVSIASDGTQGDRSCEAPSISADGRFVAFMSLATNLVKGDTNSTMDIFVHDLQTGNTTRVSIASSGMQSNGASHHPSISANGRYVSFESFASNFVTDTNSSVDIFVRDRQVGFTERVSLAADGAQGNDDSSSFSFSAISADGRFIAFYSSSSNLVNADMNDYSDVFVRDRTVIESVSLAADGAPGDGDSGVPSISADNRYVAFISDAANLVNGDTNAATDVFVYDRKAIRTERVSISSDGMQGNGSSEFPFVSANGRYVVFESAAENLVNGDTNSTVDIFVHDRDTSITERVSVASDGMQGDGPSEFPIISTDGRFIVFESAATNLVSGDTNSASDVFVHDQDTDITMRISVAPDGTQGDGPSGSPFISADGRYIVFKSAAENLVSGDTNSTVDIFVHDRDTSVTERISVAADGLQGDGASESPFISADGRYVAFTSAATNLVSEDTNGYADIFIHDRQTEQVERVSVASDGSQGNGSSDNAYLSTDGRFVAFASGATNIVSGDTNFREDVFVHDRQTGATARISLASDGTQGNGNSSSPIISADGRFVAFMSIASNLTKGDDNQKNDVFIRDRGEPAPLMPTNFLAEAVSTTQVNLSWTDNSSNEDYFVVMGSPDGDTNWMPIATADANTTSYLISDLKCGKSYFYHVRAVNSNGNADYDATVVSVQMPTCSGPTVIYLPVVQR